MPLSQSIPISSRTGFSLVEVTLAIGIVSFALVTLLGIVPIGLMANQEAMGQTARSHILKQISSDLGMLPYDKVSGYLAATQYYDYDGKRLSGQSGTTFTVALTNAAASYPGSTNLADLDQRLARVKVSIRRAAEPEAAAILTTISIFNASGRP